MLAGVMGFKRARETVSDAASKVAAAAADTRRSVVALAVLAVGALAVALWALLTARKARIA